MKGQLVKAVKIIIATLNQGNIARIFHWEALRARRLVVAASPGHGGCPVAKGQSALPFGAGAGLAQGCLFDPRSRPVLNLSSFFP